MRFTKFLSPYLVSKLCILLAVVLVPFSWAGASESEDDQEELIQEFFTAETAVVQEKGEVQLTLGIQYFEEGETKIWETPFVLEFGITDQLQVAASTTHFWDKQSGMKQASGLGEVSVEIAYGILTDMDKLVLTAGLEAVFPEQDQRDSQIQEDETEWEPFAIIARQIGAGQIHLGTGVSLEEKELEVHLAGVYPWKNWRGTLEFNGSFDDEEEKTYTPGLTWVTNGFEVGVGLVIGETQNVADNRLIVHFTREF